MRLAVALLLLPALAHADGLDAAARRAHLGRALDALAHTPQASLRRAEQVLRRAARDGCDSPLDQAPVECLLVTARRWCAAEPSPACAPAVDVVLGRLLAEPRLVPLSRRQELEGVGNAHDAVDRELATLRAELAVDFRLHRKHAGVVTPAELDDYCTMTTFKDQLGWPACAAELAWQVAEAPR